MRRAVITSAGSGQYRHVASRYASLRSTGNKLLHRRLSTSASSAREWSKFNTLGLQYLADGKLNDAESLFITAARVESSATAQLSDTEARLPANVIPLQVTLLNLGIAQRLKGRYKDAFDTVAMALSKAVIYADDIGHDIVGLMYRESGLSMEALDNAARAEVLYGDSVRWYDSAVARTSKRKNADAKDEKLEEEMSRIRRERASAAYALAVMREELKRYEEADTAYAAAVERASEAYGAISVNVAEVHMARGKMLLQLSGRRADAGSAIMNAIDIYSAKKDARFVSALKLYLTKVEDFDDEVADQLIYGDTQQKPPPNIDQVTASSTLTDKTKI